MGKMESIDLSPFHTVKRELREECNLFLEEKYILARNQKTLGFRKILFKKYSIIEEKPNHLSPGFSTSMQYPFIIQAQTYSNDFYQELQEDFLFSQEQDLNVSVKQLNQKLIQELDGLSKYYLLNFLYQQLLIT